MGWKNNLGQFIGIFVGVGIGMFGVNYAIYALKGRPEPVQQYDQYAYNAPVQQNAGIFDEVVSNVSPTR
jgi:hypothetical protein